MNLPGALRHDQWKFNHELRNNPWEPLKILGLVGLPPDRYPVKYTQPSTAKGSRNLYEHLTELEAEMEGGVRLCGEKRSLFQNYLYEVHERLKIIFLEKLIGNL